MHFEMLMKLSNIVALVLVANNEPPINNAKNTISLEGSIF